MVEAAKTDIIGPAVAAKDPDGILRQVFLVSQDFLALVAAAGFQLGDQLGGSNLVQLAVFLGCQELVNGSLDSALSLLSQSLYFLDGNIAEVLLSIENTKAELGVIFKQGVSPCGTKALLINGVRSCRGRTSPDRRTSSSIGNEHAIAEQLSGQLGVRSFAAACTGAGELKQRLLELAALNSGVLEFFVDFWFNRQVEAIGKYFLLLGLAVQGCQRQSLVALLTRAYIDTASATGAVHHRNSHTELVARHTGHIQQLGCSGSLGSFVRSHNDRTDNCMRTNIRTEVTLNTIVRVPNRNINSDTAFLVSRGAYREHTVYIFLKGGNRKLVASLTIDSVLNIGYIFYQRRCLALNNALGLLINCISPGSGNFNFLYFLCAALNSLIVHVDDSFTLLPVGFQGSVFHILNSLVSGDNVSQLEESGLQDGIDAAAQTDLLAQLHAIDDIELNVVLLHILLVSSRQSLFNLCLIPSAVKKESSAVLQILDHVIFTDIGGVVAGHKVSLVNQVSGLNG